MRCRCTLNMSWLAPYLRFRVYHSTLTVFVATSLLMCDTSIRQHLVKRENATEVVKALGYFVLLTFSVVMYHLICNMDPGYVTPDMVQGETGSYSDGLGADGHVKLRRCGFCDLVQPLRSRHCEECKRCVRKFDHHCPWFETCIGERNHKYFLLYLVLKSFVIIWTLRIVLTSFHSAGDWSSWFHTNAFMLIDSVILFLSVFSVMGLALIHTYVAIVNQTTWEMVSRMRISYLKDLDIEENPFHRGYFKNAYYFLCNNVVRRWEMIYNKRLLQSA